MNIARLPDRMFVVYDDQNIFDAIEDTVSRNYEQFNVDGLLESKIEEICKLNGHLHCGAVSMHEGASFGDIVIVTIPDDVREDCEPKVEVAKYMHRSRELSEKLASGIEEVKRDLKHGAGKISEQFYTSDNKATGFGQL